MVTHGALKHMNSLLIVEFDILQHNFLALSLMPHFNYADMNDPRNKAYRAYQDWNKRITEAIKEAKENSSRMPFFGGSRGSKEYPALFKWLEEFSERCREIFFLLFDYHERPVMMMLNKEMYLEVRATIANNRADAIKEWANAHNVFNVYLVYDGSEDAEFRGVGFKSSKKKNMSKLEQFPIVCAADPGAKTKPRGGIEEDVYGNLITDLEAHGRELDEYKTVILYDELCEYTHFLRRLQPKYTLIVTVDEDQVENSKLGGEIEEFLESFYQEWRFNGVFANLKKKNSSGSQPTLANCQQIITLIGNLIKTIFTNTHFLRRIQAKYTLIVTVDEDQVENLKLGAKWKSFWRVFIKSGVLTVYSPI